MTVNEKMTNLANAIREKTGGTEPLTIDGMTEAVNSIQSGDILHVDSLYNLLANCDYSDKPIVEIIAFEKIRRDLANITCSAQYMVRDSIGIKKLILKSSRDDIMVNGTFWVNINSVEEVDISEFKPKIKEATHKFTYSTYLKKIIGELDYSLITTGTINDFWCCNNLEEVRFKKGCASVSVSIPHSSKLSDASIQSIIDALVDLTGATTQTITFHSDVTTKLTDAQLTQITSKNWNLG